jgi:hypothetical protein
METSYTTSQFLALPLAERIRLILGRQVAFYRGTTPIDPKQALAHLRSER